MTKKHLQLLTLYLLCCAPFALTAQKRTLENVLEARLSNMGAIYEGTQVKGYFMFYHLDKAEAFLKANFKIVILDEDLNVIAEKAVEELNTIELLSVSLNGSSLLAEYYDNTAYSKYLKHYDLKLNLLEESKYRFGSTWDLMFQTPFSHGKKDWKNVVPIDKKGFVYYYNIDNYRMAFFPEKGEKGWDVKLQDGDVYAAGYLAHSDKILLNTVVKKKQKRLKKMESFVQGIELATGKVVFEKAIPITDMGVYAMAGYLDDAGNFVVSGRYDDFDDVSVADMSNCAGVFTMKISQKGEVLSHKSLPLTSWSTSNFKVDEKERVNQDGRLRIFETTRTKNGNLYFIGEIRHYEKNMIQSEDMVSIEFDADLTLKGVNIFNKTKRQEDQIEYHFLLPNSDNSLFSIYYKTTNFKVKPTQEYMNVQSKKVEEQQYAQDIIVLPASSTFSYALPAKYGHVLLIDYFRKDKKIDMRIEKVNQ